MLNAASPHRGDSRWLGVGPFRHDGCWRHACNRGGDHNRRWRRLDSVDAANGTPLSDLRWIGRRGRYRRPRIAIPGSTLELIGTIGVERRQRPASGWWSGPSRRQRADGDCQSCNRWNGHAGGGNGQNNTVTLFSATNETGEIVAAASGATLHNFAFIQGSGAIGPGDGPHIVNETGGTISASNNPTMVSPRLVC